MGNELSTSSGDDKKEKKVDKILRGNRDKAYGPKDMEEFERTKNTQAKQKAGLSKDAYFAAFKYSQEQEKRAIAKEYIEEYSKKKDEINQSTDELKKFTAKELNEMDKNLESIGKAVYALGKTIQNNNLIGARLDEALNSAYKWKDTLNTMQSDIISMKGYKSSEVLKNIANTWKGEVAERDHVRRMFEVVSIGVLACTKRLEAMRPPEQIAGSNEISIE
jgi:hypothetical protein